MSGEVSAQAISAVGEFGAGSDHFRHSEAVYGESRLRRNTLETSLPQRIPVFGGRYRFAISGEKRSRALGKC